MFLRGAMGGWLMRRARGRGSGDALVMIVKRVDDVRWHFPLLVRLLEVTFPEFD